MTFEEKLYKVVNESIKSITQCLKDNKCASLEGDSYIYYSHLSEKYKGIYTIYRLDEIKLESEEPLNIIIYGTPIDGKYKEGFDIVSLNPETIISIADRLLIKNS